MGSGDVPTDARPVCMGSQNCEKSERFQAASASNPPGDFCIVQTTQGRTDVCCRPSQEPMSRGARFLRVGARTIGSRLFAEVRAKVRELTDMDSIIYLVGLIVVVMFILSLLGLH
jgi:hypothetical protein